MKPIQLTLIATIVASVAPLANADFDGAISDSTNREIGESTVNVPLFHTSGRAGIGSTGGGKVDFQGLAGNIFNSKTRNGIETSGSRHFGSSHYNFKQVASQDIWFGEWYEGTQDQSFDKRTVYYIGDDSGTTMPTGGEATYNITGINKFSGSNQLKGELTANFSAQTLTGDFSNGDLKIDINSTINASDASFSGSATATQGATVTNGNSQGHFFGNNAASLAGIATFAGNSDLDTAFGGEKK